jgi:uncharacterized protein
MKRIILLVTALAFLPACYLLRTEPPSDLIGAARRGDAAAVTRLLRSGADPNERGGINGWTALMHAVHKQQPAAVRALLEGKADADARAGKGYTALIMAAGYGNEEIVRLLLEHGADPMIKASDGETALNAAVSGTMDIDKWTHGQCQTGTVRTLIEYSPSLRKDTAARAALASKSNCEEVAALLRQP